MGKNNIDSSFRLSTGDRNSRLILIVTLIGSFAVFFTFLIELLKTYYNQLYISSAFKNLPFGTEHFVMPIFLTSVSFILYYSIKYCFSEARNFGMFESHEDITRFEKLADKNYKELLNQIKLHFFLVLGLLYFSFIIFNTPIYIAIISAVILVIALIVKIMNDKINIMDMAIIKEFSILKLGIWLFLLILWFLMGISFSNTALNREINFQFVSDPNPSVNIKIKNISTIPKDFNITIENADGKEEIILKDSNFSHAFLEVTSHEYVDKNNNTSTSINTKLMYGENIYEYSSAVNLSNYLINGNNYIVITYSVEGFPTVRNYRLVNEVSIVNGKLTFSRDEFSAKL